MFQEYCLCTCLLCTSEILFTENWNNQQFLSVILYILLWLYLDILYQEKWILNHIIKTTVLVSDMILCFVVCMWLKLWQCQVWQKQFHSHVISFLLSSEYKCKHLYFPIVHTFKELYNEKLRNRIQFCIILTDQANMQWEH